MKILVDYNFDGHATVILGALMKSGWLDFVSIQFVSFKEAGLARDSSDRLVWQYAQANQMMILTANRNMKGEDSLEQVMREENTLNSFPILTISDTDRMDDPIYRDKCVNSLLSIIIDIENYMGVGRLFIPIN